MKKHAYLIMAHNEFYILEKLLRLIDDSRNDIYLHIDKKVKNFDFDYYKKIVKKSNLYFTERISVNWGCYSQIECELILLKEATKNNYDYYHLLSGVDLPLKNQDYIHDFFDNCGHLEFVHYSNHKGIDDSVLDRVRYYHLFMKNVRSSNKIKRIFSQKLNSFFIKVQKKIKYSRIKSREDSFYFGANWFSITNELANYVVSCEGFISENFKKTVCADEIFLQTIVHNSEFYDKLYLYKDKDYSQVMRFIDWDRGNPYTFKKSDFEDLVSTEMLFARKFSSLVDKKIVDMIYKRLR